MSMLEVVISAFLFGAVSIVLLNLYPSALLGMARTQARTRAVELARSTLATVRSLPWDELAVGTDKVLETRTVDAVAYKVRLVVLNPPEGSADRLRLVRVIISWDQKSLTREAWVVHARH